MRYGTTRPTARRRVRATLLAAALVAGAGCSMLGPQRLDIEPGFAVIVGEIDMRSVPEPQGLLQMVREDGAVRYDLPVQRGPFRFAVPLPPGRYRMVSLRVIDTAQVSPDHIDYLVGATFDVTMPAVYLGTVRFEREQFGAIRLRVVVVDDFDRTVPAVRARYPDLPATVERSLLRPDA